MRRTFDLTTSEEPRVLTVDRNGYVVFAQIARQDTEEDSDNAVRLANFIPQEMPRA